MCRCALAFIALAVLQVPAQKSKLTVRLVDADTGHEISGTLQIRTSDGGLVAKGKGFTEGVRSPGIFEVELESGQTSITAHRGFDYHVEQRQVDLRPGTEQSVTLALRRRTPLRQEGWVTGDSHVHMVHGEAQVPATFADVAIAARAEGLDYLSVAQAWNLPNPTADAPTDVCSRYSTPGFVMTWNLEAPKNYWQGDASHCMGHGWTLGMRDRTADNKDPIAEFSALNAHDYEREKIAAPNFDTHALIHNLGGIVSYTHPARWWRGSWGGTNGYPLENGKFVSNLAQELPFDTIAGPTYDMLDILMRPHEREVNRLGQQLWFMLLNHGYRIAGTASSDATFDRPGGAVPGKVRTYTRIDGAFSIAKVAQAMRAGRNIVTSGPLLTIDINGHQIGESFAINGPTSLRVHLRAWAAPEPGSSLPRIELIRNGDVIRRVGTAKDQIDTVLVVEERESAWYIVRATGNKDDDVAITNPIFVERGLTDRPSATPANVHLEVLDGASGQQIAASVAVIERIGRQERVEKKESCDGTCELVIPATSRLRIEADGYDPALRSIFLDTPELLNGTLNTRVEQLLDWSTYERIRSTLSKIEFRVELNRVQTP